MATKTAWFRIGLLALLLTGCVRLPASAADTAVKAVAAEAKEETAAAPERLQDPFASLDGKMVRKYCLVKGSTYDKVTACLASLDPAGTDLDARKRPYYFRVSKKLTDNYFRHIRAYDKETHGQIGDYYVARDGRSIWRLDGDKAGLLAGTAKKVMDRTVILVYPYMELGETATVRLRTPGNVPYKVTAKSLDENVVRVDGTDRIVPVKLGKTVLFVEAEIGDVKDTGSVNLRVVTKEELRQIAYASYMRRLYVQRMMEESLYWDDWGPRGWGYGPRYYGHRPPPPPRGHRPPPPPKR